MTETWKPIPNFDGYEVSNHGRVRSFKKKEGTHWIVANKPQRILRPGLSKGYRMVRLSRSDGILQSFRIASLVLLAFVGPVPEGTEVCHQDCNPFNDRLSNLRYDTHLNNIHDGAGEHSTRLTNAQALEVRKLARQGMGDEILADKFNVPLSSICNCRLGYTYHYVRGPLTKRKVGPKAGGDLTNQEVRQMRHEGQQGTLIVELAQRYGVDLSYVSLILRGLRRKKAGGPISPSRYLCNKE